jgi:ABC-2 type transport system ATP-binding protein
MARYLGMADSWVDEALHTMDLSGRGRDKFSGYSLGMKQRLGVAAALLGNPELLILDEPTNGLDPAGVSDMRDLIRTLAGDGHTVLLSSHMLAEVQQLCDRVGVISKGKFVAEGTVAELRGQGHLMVSAHPWDLARSHAERLLGPERVSMVSGLLRLDAAPEDAARINRELVTAGVDVAEIRWAEKDLEEVFFEMTQSDEMTDTTNERGPGISSDRTAAYTELEGARR